MHLLVTLLGFFTDQNDRFLYPLIYVKYWNPHPYIYPKPEKKKKVPLSHEASPYRPWQGVSFPRIDKSPSAVLFVHYSFVFSPKYSISMLHCFHLKFLLISYRSCCYGLNGWLRLFGRSCRFICRHGCNFCCRRQVWVGVLHCICHRDGPTATATRSAGKLSVSGVNKSSSAIYYKVLK